MTTNTDIEKLRDAETAIDRAFWRQLDKLGQEVKIHETITKHGGSGQQQSVVDAASVLISLREELYKAIETRVDAETERAKSLGKEAWEDLVKNGH